MLLVYSEHMSPRLDYILQFLLKDILGISYVHTIDQQVFSEAKGPRLNYSGHRMADEFFIASAGLLEENGFRQFEVPVSHRDGNVLLFPVDAADLDLDIFSAAFYLISRYEEYLPFRKDRHGRFEADQSLAFKHGFLDRPVIDQWAYAFREKLIARYPELNYIPRKFLFKPTIDIDQAFAIRHKHFFRVVKSLAGSAVRFDFAALRYKWRVLCAVEPDPFDQFAKFEELHRKYGLQAVYFILFGNKYSTYDINIRTGNSSFRRRIRFVSETADVGIHPSYRSQSHTLRIEEEKYALSQVTGHTIDRSRQHFLRMRIPNTYKSLISAGIKKDYTMGYASGCGFRAGTCTPFQFYDLKHEQISFLKVYPFCIMDTTLHAYLKLSPDEAFIMIRQFISEVKKVEGLFIPLWHNESLSNYGTWAGWGDLYEKMLSLSE